MLSLSVSPSLSGPDVDGVILLINADVSNADLSITLSASPDPVTPGDNITYTLQLKNDGPTAARDVTVTEAIPPNTTFVSFDQTSVSPGFTLTPKPSVGGTGTAKASIGSLAVGESGTFKLKRTLLAGSESEARGHYAITDVSGVLQMVAKRGRRNLAGGAAMQIRHCSESRLACRPGIHLPAQPLAERQTEERRQLAKDIVRMLQVNQRYTLIGLTGLKEFVIAAMGRGERLGGEHLA